MYRDIVELFEKYPTYCTIRYNSKHGYIRIYCNKPKQFIERYIEKLEPRPHHVPVINEFQISIDRSRVEEIARKYKEELERLIPNSEINLVKEI